MKNKKQFSTAISNEEHLAKAKEVYENEVQPFIKGNKKAYKKYLQDKETLSLSPAQKASLQCQSHV